ncbi:MAG: EAL domain-containing protein [Rhodoblastus sp.]|nr:MAG: EAL domain-containing protein [Rhodoblastus sp.]
MSDDHTSADVSSKGRGVDSIPIRFALMCGALTAFGVVGWRMLSAWAPDQVPGLGGDLVSIVCVGAPTGAVYWAARKLARQIEALRRSAEAVVAGDFDRASAIDCACEVGGLAASFRKMVDHLNASIVRMNMLAYVDPVTGLPNRAVVEHMLERMVGEGGPGGAVLFIDLDGFKRVNDTHGHASGDELLRQASARAIRRGFGREPGELDACANPFGALCDRPPRDVVFARFAGDEFVALVPGPVDDATLHRRADAIVAALRRPFDVYSQEVKIGASIGLARAPRDSNDAREILTFADMAMYVAKQAGRGRVAAFDPKVRRAAIERAEIETELRHALAGETLELAFQPKLDAHTLECVGVEALARWTHATRGVIAPGVFIPIAEQCGLMGALGAQVVSMAAQQARLWRQAGRALAIAVNVSPAQFESPDFARSMLELCARNGVDPNVIEVEITESMAMADIAATTRRVCALREAGMRISIDDFGIGYSNLSHLSRLPIDDIKIDRSLVIDIGASPRSERILRALIEMAHALGDRVIAEGVETQAQHDFLRAAGCDCVQGFLFARPMTAQALEAWFAARPREASARQTQAPRAAAVA